MVATQNPQQGPAASFTATLPFLLGCVLLVLMCFPGLGELPGGISPALVLMFGGLPIWYVAACARQGGILDEASAAGTAIILLCAGFLMLWSLLSVVNAEVPFRAGRYFATAVAAFAYYFLVVGTVTRRRLDIYLNVLCFTLAFTCLLSLAGYYEPHLRSIIFDGTDRAYGFFKNPNQFGMVLSTLLPVATAIFLGHRRRRFLWAGCLALFLFGLVACGSKTNLILSLMTFVFVLCTYSVVTYSGRTRLFMMGMSIVFTAIMVAGAVVLLNSFNPRALRLMLEFFSQDGELDSLVTRNQLWQYSIRQFMARPFLGEGAGQVINIFYRQGYVPHSHNVLFDYIRALGAPGFFGLLIVLGTAVLVSVGSVTAAFQATNAAGHDRILCIGLAIGCLSYIAANMSSDSMGPSTSPFFWLVLYLGFSTRSLLRTPAAS